MSLGIGRCPLLEKQGYLVSMLALYRQQLDVFQFLN